MAVIAAPLPIRLGRDALAGAAVKDHTGEAPQDSFKVIRALNQGAVESVSNEASSTELVTREPTFSQLLAVTGKMTADGHPRAGRPASAWIEAVKPPSVSAHTDPFDKMKPLHQPVSHVSSWSSEPQS